MKYARCHDIHTRFHKDRFSHSEVDAGGDTQTAWRSHIPTLIFSY
jgi:hypothetical protein